VRFSSAGLPHQQKTGFVQWVLFHESARCHPSWCEAGKRSLKLEVGQLAVLVSLRNPSRGQQNLSPRAKPTVAAGDAAIIGAADVADSSDRFPSGTLAERANLRRSLYALGSFHLRAACLLATYLFANHLQTKSPL
jgi:hypothetical protein